MSGPGGGSGSGSGGSGSGGSGSSGNAGGGGASNGARIAISAIAIPAVVAIIVALVQYGPTWVTALRGDAQAASPSATTQPSTLTSPEVPPAPNAPSRVETPPAEPPGSVAVPFDALIANTGADGIVLGYRGFSTAQGDREGNTQWPEGEQVRVLCQVVDGRAVTDNEYPGGPRTSTVWNKLSYGEDTWIPDMYTDSPTSQGAATPVDSCA